MKKGRVFCKEHNDWDFRKIFITDKPFRSMECRIELCGNAKVSVGKKITIITPFNSYKFIVHSFSYHRPYNTSVLSLKHPYSYIAESRITRFYKDKKDSDILKDLFKEHKINYKIKLYGDYKREISVIYNETCRDAINRICWNNSVVLQTMADGSVRIDKLKILSGSNPFTKTNNSPHGEKELFVIEHRHINNKASFQFFGYMPHNPLHPFFIRNNSSSIEKNLYNYNIKSIKEGQEIEKSYNNNQLYSETIATTNAYVPLLNSVGVDEECVKEVTYKFIYEDGLFGGISEVTIGYLCSPEIPLPIIPNQIVKVVTEKKEKAQIDKQHRVFIQFYEDYKEQSFPASMIYSIAHKAGGYFHFPRKNSELIVVIKDERILIIGSIYNKDNKIPKKINKYSLGLTVNSPGHVDRVNSLLLNNEPKKEQFNIIAQKDYNLHVIEGDMNTNVDGKNVKVETNIKGKNSKVITNIECGDYELTLKKGKLHIKTKGNIAIEADGNMTFKSSKKISMDAEEITIKANNISIKTTMDLTITAMKLKIKATVLFQLAASTIKMASSILFNLSSKSIMKITSNVLMKVASKVLMQLEAKILMTKSPIHLVKTKVHVSKAIAYVRSSPINLIDKLFLCSAVIIKGLWAFSIPI